MPIQGHRVKQKGRLARAARGVVRAKSVHAAIGLRPCSASLAMRSAKTRQSPMTCSRRHSGKMAVAAEAAPVVVRPAQAAHAVVHAKETLAAVVAAMQAGKVSRAAAIVLPAQTTRPAVLSQTR